MTDWRDFEPPVEGKIYKMHGVMREPHPDTGEKLVFTHALSHGVNAENWACRFDLLVDADQPLTPREYELRYDRPWARFGITWDRPTVHRYVKLDLDRRVDPMESLAKALNEVLANKARRLKRERS